jgi:hypothetical protein
MSATTWGKTTTLRPSRTSPGTRLPGTAGVPLAIIRASCQARPYRRAAWPGFAQAAAGSVAQWLSHKHYAGRAAILSWGTLPYQAGRR